MINPCTPVSTVPLYGCLAAVVSGAVFNKSSHIIEYILTKTFGDYKNPKMTLDGKIIIRMPIYKDYYYAQNIILAPIVAAISSKAVQILALASYPSTPAFPLLFGSMAASILFSSINMIVRHTGGHHGRWVEITDAEIKKHGIDKSNIEKIGFSARVYCSFGAAPIYFRGEFTQDPRD